MNIWSRACFMIDTLERNGAQKQLLLMAKHLQENKLPGYCLIVFREPLTLIDDFIKAGVNVILLKKKNTIDLFFFIKLIRVLIKIKPSIVVTFLISPDIWGRLAAFISGIPVVGSSVRNMPQDLGFLKDNILYFLDRLSDFIVCNCMAAAEIITKRGRLNREKISVIYNGIEFTNSEDLVSDNKEKVHEKIIGLVARLVPEKDISTLLRAFSRIQSSFQVRLIVVGDGPLRPNLEIETATLGISEKVFFSGERFDANQMIMQFDIGVLTSFYEGLSNAIMEYMVAGKPVVATNVGGNPELVDDGITGYLFEPGDASQLAEILHVLLVSPDCGAQMGRAGREKMIASFSVNAMFSAWDAVLSQAISKVTGENSGERNRTK